MHVCSVLSQDSKSKTKSIFGMLSVLLLMFVLPMSVGAVTLDKSAVIRASDGHLYEIQYTWPLSPEYFWIDSLDEVSPSHDVVAELYIAARILNRPATSWDIYENEDELIEWVDSETRHTAKWKKYHWLATTVGSVSAGYLAGAISGAFNITTSLIETEGLQEIIHAVIATSLLVTEERVTSQAYLITLAYAKQAVFYRNLYEDMLSSAENGTEISIQYIMSGHEALRKGSAYVQYVHWMMNEYLVLPDRGERLLDFALAVFPITSLGHFFASLGENVEDVRKMNQIFNESDEHITQQVSPVVNAYFAEDVKAHVISSLESAGFFEREPPMTVNTIDDIEIMVGDRPLLRDVTSRFSDPNGDELDHSLHNTDENVADVKWILFRPDGELNFRSFLEIRPKIPGTTEVTVTATDPNGLSVSMNFTVTVTEQAPFEAPEPARTIDPISLTLEGGATTVDVEQNFNATNPLTFSTDSIPRGIVTTSESGTIITITPIALGVATVVVTARDTVNTGLTAIQTIPVLVRQTGATIVRPTNTDPIWRPTTISNPRAEGLREGVSVIVDGLAFGGNLNVRSGAGTNYADIGDVTNGDYGIITDGPRSANGFTWWEIDWDTQRLDGWSAEVVGGIQLLFRRPPDLEIRDLDVSDSEVGPGEEIELEIEIRNNGPGESAPTDVYIFYSENSYSDLEDLADDSDLRGGWRLSVPSIRERRTQTLTYRVDAPTVIDSYYYGALLPDNRHPSDNTDHLDEDAIRNNLARKKEVEVVGSPDYIVDSISLSGNRTTFDPGESFTLRATVRNIGLGEPSSSADLDYYRSSDARISTSDRWVDDDSVSRLDTNETGNEFVSLTAPTEPGVYYYGACVSDVRNETDRSNNCSGAIAITVRQVITPVEATGSPDLVVSLTSNISLVDPNGYISLEATLQNQGDADASNSTTLRYYLSTDTIVSSDDQLIATDSVRSLNQGDSDNEDHGVRVPSQPGRYYYYACVDSVTDEEDTSNNCSNFISINVRGSDLVVESVSVDLLGQTGGINPRGEFTLNATVRNRGTGNAGATTVRYYISQDQTFSTVNDSEVQAGSIGAINAGTSTNAQSTNIRSSNTSGSFYCFVCVDGLSNEINTGNNCSNPIQITIRNVAPRARGKIPVQTLNIGSTKSLSVSNNFVDDNNDTLTYQARSSDDNIATATVSGSQVTITPKKAGSVNITVTASDGILTATQTVSVTVIDPNRAPLAVGTISPLTLTIGDAPEEIDVSSKFRDPDNDDLKYTASSNNTSVATATMTQAKLTITSKSVGNATITVTASDGTLTATQTISATVIEKVIVNSTPTAVGTISDRTLTVGDAAIQIDVSSNFSDPDDDTLEFSATSDDDNVATATVSGSIVTITPKSAGSATITVAVSDAELTATQTISVTVTAAPVANRAPFTVGAISSQTLTEGESAIQIDVSSNFSDPDGDTLTYSASSDDDGVATASATGSQITITPIDAGSATITVTASDSELTATQTISVTVVGGNRAPVTVDTIASQTLIAGGTSVVVDVSGNFRDPNNDALIYSATSNATSVATVGATGSQVTIIPVAVGNAIITVIANDGELTATQTISVSVVIGNRAPVAVGTIASQTLIAGGTSVVVDVSGNFRDPNNDDLVYSATSNATSVATVSVTGSQITITTISVGSATITVSASDGLFTATRTISVSVTAANRAPVPVGVISNRTFTVGDSSQVVDVSSNFNDPDEDNLAYSANSNNTNVANANASGSRVTITPIGVGSATITVTASDAELTTTQTISVTVTAAPIPNRAPVTVGAISNQTMTVGDPAVVLDVSDNFNDPDNDNLVYSVSSSATTVATVSVSGSEVTITPVAAGSTTITVTASDGELAAAQTISVSVAAPNRAPVAVGTISSQTLTAGSSAVVVNVSGNFNDPDNDDLVYSVSSSATAVATVSVSGAQITITPVAAGSTTITVTASDGELAATQTISVSVAAPNRAPVAVGTISSQTLTAGSSAVVVNVSGNFNDPDNDDLVYSASSSATSVATVSVSGAQITITPVAAGSTTITVTASDGELAATQTISVSVAAPNRAPVAVGTIAAQSLTAGGSAVVVNVSGNFNDPDNDDLVYSASSSATSVATVSVSGAQITITPVAAGSTTITVTASDGELTATQTISVSVAAANRAPVAFGTIAAQTLTPGGSAVVVNVSSNFNDPDNDGLVYSASSSATAVATVSVSGSQITITPVAAGSTTITVTASDGSLSATQTISVSVTPAITEETWMPDANLRAKVRSRLSLQTDESLTQEAVQGLDWLNANDAQITDITGLEHATNLTSLNLSENQISDLTPISGLTGLDELRLWKNNISNITPLTGLQIYHLGLSENDVSDITPLTNLTNLSLLNLSDNEISNITPLRNLTRIWYLNLSNNQISNITTLSNLTRFSTVEGGMNKALYLSDNQISDITTLSSLTALRVLDLSNNQISSVTSLENLNELVDLFLTGNSITDDSPLRRLQTNNQNVRIDIVNRAPFTVGTIPDRTFETNDNAATIHISRYFSDRDRNTVLVYNASSNNTPVASVSRSGSTITITPGSIGNATITVTASDGELTATQTFSVTVTADEEEEDEDEEDWLPDENLRTLVRSQLGLTSDETLTKQAMPDLTDLDDNYGFEDVVITDLTGLEYATGLTSIILTYRQHDISDLSPLYELTSLTYLELTSDQISDITPIRNLTSLTDLVIDDAQISNISSLQNLISITKIILSNNQISSISSLQNLTSLTWLDMQDNEISDLSPLDELTTLTYLDLSDNQISDISDIEDLTALTRLDLANNQISDVSSLEDLTALRILYLDNNQISDVSSLEDLTALTRLDVEGNSITDYGPLRRLQAKTTQTISIDVDITTDPNNAPAVQTTPTKTVLLPNYPNPFNPETWIPYQLSKSADVTLTFYNVSGVMVRQLVLGHQTAGVYYSRNRAAHWDGKNNLGEKVSIGVYFVKFRAGNYTKIRKMLIRK